MIVLEITVKMFRRAKKLNPQIIHCHDTPVLPLGLALKFATGAKIIYDAHELESERNGLSKSKADNNRTVWRREISHYTQPANG